MSDTTDTTNPDDNNNPDEKKNWRRDLEDRLKAAEERAEKAETENTTIKRTEALKAAGLDLSVKEDGKPTNPLHHFFANKYDGKLDVDAIKADATGTGVLQPPAADTQTQQIANQHAQLDRASVGAESVAQVGSQEALVEALTKATNSNDQKAFYAALAEQGMTVKG